MRANNDYNVKQSAVPTTFLTLISGLFIIGVVGFLLYVGNMTKSIHEDVGWGLSKKEQTVQDIELAKGAAVDSNSNTRARLANVPEQFTNEDEIELLKLRNGEIDPNTLRSDVVSELMQSDK